MAFGRDMVWPEEQHPWKISPEGPDRDAEARHGDGERRRKNSRVERRLACQRMVTLQVLSDDGHDVETAANLTDVSSRGLGLHVSQRLAPGQRFSLNLVTAQGPCAYFYEVTRSTQTPDEIWHVGARALGMLGRNGADRPEKIILALMTGRPNKNSA